MPVLCVNACHLGVCFHVFFFMLSSVFLCLLVCVITSFWSVFLCTIGVSVNVCYVFLYFKASFFGVYFLYVILCVCV